jgi:hypothetical protein
LTAALIREVWQVDAAVLDEDPLTIVVKHGEGAPQRGSLLRAAE